MGTWLIALECCGWKLAHTAVFGLASGVMNCIELAKDYYQQKFNIEIPDFNDEIRYWPIKLLKFRKWIKAQNMVLIDFYKANGFYEVVDYKIGDLILMNSNKIQSPHNILIYLGPNKYLTHNHGEKSKIIHSNLNKSNIISVLRHKCN